MTGTIFDLSALYLNVFIVLLSLDEGHEEEALFPVAIGALDVGVSCANPWFTSFVNVH